MIKYKAISDVKINDLTGQKIGKLTVIGLSETRNKYNRIMWDCICDCGNKKSISADMLNKTLRGQIGTKSCGCLRILCSTLDGGVIVVVLFLYL